MYKISFTLDKQCESIKCKAIILGVSKILRVTCYRGHPYLTGLAVAGGLFCMGMEGAIIGPLILCCLYVVVSMSSSIMQDATTPT